MMRLAHSPTLAAAVLLAASPAPVLAKTPFTPAVIAFSLAMLFAVIATAIIVHAARLKAWQKFVIVLLSLMVAIPFGSIPPASLPWFFRTSLWSFVFVFTPAVVFGALATWFVLWQKDRAREEDRFSESDDFV
jgi:hypothetical protein